MVGGATEFEVELRTTILPPRDSRAHPRAHVALDRANDVDAAADRPPAVARLFHEAEALEPAPLRERRRVTAETSAGQLEPEQREPVLQPQQTDELSAPGDLSSLPTERARRAPQRQGIESGNDDAAFGHQHALRLAQD